MISYEMKLLLKNVNPPLKSVHFDKHFKRWKYVPPMINWRSLNLTICISCNLDIYFKSSFQRELFSLIHSISNREKKERSLKLEYRLSRIFIIAYKSHWSHIFVLSCNVYEIFMPYTNDMVANCWKQQLFEFNLRT